MIAAPLFGLVAFSAMADVRLHGIFGDHMVLQREVSVRVWGWASAGEAIEVTFRKQQKRVVADHQGGWAVRLDPEAAGGPHELVVSGHNTLRVRDVLVGEVWLCTGQSNMEWALKDSQDGPAEVAAANRPQIRHVKIPHRTAMQPMDDLETVAWQPSHPDTAGGFSAIGYYFAQKLHQELGVPVGLINVSWGGTNIETWMSREAFQAHRELRVVLPGLPVTPEAYVAQHRTRSMALVQRWQADFTGSEDTFAWKDRDYPDSGWGELNAPGIWETQGLDGFDGKLWYRRAVDLSAIQTGKSASLHLGLIDDCDETFVNGQKVGGQCAWDTPRRYDLAPGLLIPGRNVIAVRVTDNGGGGGFYGVTASMKLMLGHEEIGLAGTWKARVEAPMEKSAPHVNDLPSLAFNAMLNPLVGFGVRGALWYQGESNVSRAAQYESSFPLLIADTRKRWGQGDFPFLYVQLAAFLPLEKNTLAGSTWAELREAQRKTLAVRNTGMAVATDIGDAFDIHPRNKREVGLRLARIALKDSYGRRLQASGPTLINTRRVGNQMELRFSNVAQGLLVKGDRLQGFAIADSARQFRPAEARVAGRDTIVVSNADVKRPRAVRFGWVDNPQENNLFNSEGLPASPFRTDRWPRLTDGKVYGF